MSCRRLRRELVELVRYGELDRRSAPLLEHLAGCRECRDEVGFDRALVRQLRAVLAERVGDAAVSPAAWNAIVARAQAPDGGLRGWLRAHAVLLTGRLRVATAVSAIALAVIVAAGTDGNLLPATTDSRVSQQQSVADQFAAWAALRNRLDGAEVTPADAHSSFTGARSWTYTSPLGRPDGVWQPLPQPATTFVVHPIVLAAESGYRPQTPTVSVPQEPVAPRQVRPPHDPT